MNSRSSFSPLEKSVSERMSSIIIIVYLYSADFIIMSKSASQVPKNSNSNNIQIKTNKNMNS